jgi:hypothetical protein
MFSLRQIAVLLVDEDQHRQHRQIEAEGGLPVRNSSSSQ